MRVFAGTTEEMKDKGLQLIRLRRSSDNVVFFDIDDTLLNTGFVSPQTNYMIGIRHIIDLYRACRAVGLFTVIITARPDFLSNCTHTESELAYHGLQYDLLYMRPESFSTSEQIAQYKTMCRQDALQRLRGSPLFAIGDQTWDFGEYGGTGLWIR